MLRINSIISVQVFVPQVEVPNCDLMLVLIELIDLTFLATIGRIIVQIYITMMMVTVTTAMMLLISCSTEKIYLSRCIIEEEAPTNTRKDVELLQSEVCPKNGCTCPPWSYCDVADQMCKCIKLPGAPLRCDETTSTNVSKPPYILDCYCITYDKENTLIEVGQCDYNCARHRSDPVLDLVYQVLPPNMSDWDNFMCGEFNRLGTLCGRCDVENDYYPRAYSFDLSCIKCENANSNLWKYIALAYLPLTIFYLLIFLLKVDIHSSQLQGFITFAQYMSIPALARNIYLASRTKPVQPMIKLMGTLYGVWNLDFFRAYNNRICFRISPLATLSLDLAVAVYPLLLMLITYNFINLYDRHFKPLVLLWRPFKALFSKWHRNFATRTSIIDAFAAFLFLTNAKFFSICFDILTPVKVFQFYTPKHINNSWRVYYDPTIVYLSSEHCLYAVIALLTLFTFIISPVLILLLYSISFFQKFLNLLPHRLQINLRTFVDSFQGCYKDGTEPGTRDCRWYAPLLYINRLFLMIIYAISLDSIFFVYGAIVLTSLALLTIIVDPFKLHLKHLSSNLTVFILFIAGFFVGAFGVIMSEESCDTLTSYIFYSFTFGISSLPLIYISLLVSIWIINHWNLGRNSITI